MDSKFWVIITAGDSEKAVVRLMYTCALFMYAGFQNPNVQQVAE